MAEMICPSCCGAGRIEHKCLPGDPQVINVIHRTDQPELTESLTIRKCRVCGQLWKVFYQRYHENTILIWLLPGETATGRCYASCGSQVDFEISFTADEARMDKVS